MHHVRNDVVQKSLIVGDDDRSLLRSMEGIHTVRNDAESVHIKSAVGLVENRESRVKHGHLEDLVTLLLTA